MHSFQKIVSDFATFHQLYVHFKTLIGFALRVSRTKGYSFKSGTSFVELAAMGEVASIMRKGRHFLITNANSFH